MPPVLSKDAAAARSMAQTTLFFGPRTIGLQRPSSSSSPALLPTLAALDSRSPSSQGMRTDVSTRSEASSVLSSASDMRGEGRREAPSEVRVELNLRPLTGNLGLVVANFALKRRLIELPALKPKRAKYNDKVKWAIVESAEELGAAEAIRRARNTPGYEKLTVHLLRKWKKALGAPKKK
eukprot:CAMPEP_0174712958 /NCGR_PEP_ID=MMETSP1094-20130205/13784_1 /TAXON_ID=156173 /ORGANISM="Chrysochromulina brevifilum, Strain UTEX LB 985" /LENGTH=179 /DNA_ID=CAMNT_0015912083 /DNA_START=333 /DNA_END=870 /DNA_ORIENTATION=+